MEKIFVYFAYLISSVICIQLALSIFGVNDRVYKGLLVAFISGNADYLVKEILVPSFNLVDYLHLFTGTIILFISCYYIFSFTIGGSISITILSYLLSGIGEFIVILVLVVIFGIDFFDSLKDNKMMLAFYAVLGQLTLLIPLFILRSKNVKFMGFTIEK